MNIAYIGAGTEYQDSNGEWKDTNGVSVSKYKDKPQRVNPEIREKYGNQENISMVLLDKSGQEIMRATVQ